jgi:hypothetical protein
MTDEDQTEIREDDLPAVAGGWGNVPVTRPPGSQIDRDNRAEPQGPIPGGRPEM